MADDRNHYEVIGINPAASKEDIRAAYRDRLEELAADVATSDDARAETARLNSAWQVLSDPYQRERYDTQEGIEVEPDAATDDDGADADEPAGDRAPARRGAAERAKRDEDAPKRIGLFSAEPVDPPPTWPPGFSPPPPRGRVIAMAIDLVVLFVLFLGVQTVGNRIIASVYEEEVDRIDALDERLDDAEDARDRAEERADDARDAAERAERQGDTAAEEEARQQAREADAQAEAADKDAEDLQEQVDDVEGDLVPAQLGITGGVLVLSLLYLVPSSVISGRTLGKQLLGIRLINADGTRLGFRAALVHYAAPVLVSLMLLPFLGQLVVFVVLIGVLTWPRNPNLQGLHDRLAGTLVVDG
jgi:RDD family/DnaJ domain